ncbi:glycosyltransferase family 2 protein [Paraburkholderia megapolitana]|uniref:Glycosyl transferase family 2 n=1 Tax=Paraburkholderia megapolitana TaxID=420953 RepID=A0A1I3VLY0_9BURK|nr:glycosyltransferase family 2 protein [Paraburkholderia megapolitana]QDQ84741.1 glycosyltransferase family 2 protein [Paraburkholderia megapolitana]SFJ96162.1 Glycosyl transferase family 2 [Paraburkholderia megapolitana]
MTIPDISCVIPTYNDRTNLTRAVESVLAQHDVRVEVILVDDYSNAETREFITQLTARDNRIRNLFLPRNGGQSLARNIGAMLAQGRFLTFLDQDDEHAAGWYRDAVDHLLTNPDVGALSGHAAIVDIPQRFGIDESDIRVRGLSLVFINNIVFRRSIFLASGGFPTSATWRNATAGEDGVYRLALFRHWQFVRCERLALIHRAKEGGATVYFLDRNEVRDGQVVAKEYHEIEINGELAAAQEAFFAQAAEIAEEIQRCIKQQPEL